jgi:polyphenol oxidase
MLPGFRAGWIPRIPGVDVLGDREFALRNLHPHHQRMIAEKFPNEPMFHFAEQVHGGDIAVIDAAASGPTRYHPGADGLVTNLPGQLLAIYVADCAAIYLADPVNRAIGLLHSGKKGTELNILANAVGKMTSAFGTNPADLICILSPCIRPPHYEVDIAEGIARQARHLGIKNFHDSCQNTAADLSLHYSYRMEKGQTGRMLALLCTEHLP